MGFDGKIPTGGLILNRNNDLHLKDVYDLAHHVYDKIIEVMKKFAKEIVVVVTDH
jgi:hypothetical protein